MPIFIYGLHCPVSETIRYVGKSRHPGRRLNGHLCGARRGYYAHHTARWLRKLQADGLKPSVVVLHEVVEGERWQDIERQFIASAAERGWLLTNSTAGGEGLDYRDPEDDRQYREKLSRTHKALWSTPERRAEATARSRAVAADSELLAKRNKAIKAAYQRPEVVQRMVFVGVEIGARPEVKAARSAASKANWENPEYRSVLTRSRNDPEFTARQSQRLRGRWADPAAREKMNAARWTPEKRSEQAARIRAYNASRSTKG